MRDDTAPDTDALDEGALLDAYLDGETDEITTGRLERRLADDTDLAARLDALAMTRARLQRLSDVSAPTAARARLGERLEAERARGADTADEQARGVPASTAPPTARPVEAGAVRRRSSRVAPALAAAAAIAAVTVLGLAAFLTQFGSESAEEAGQAEAAGAPADAAAGAQLEQQGADTADEAAAGTAGAASEPTRALRGTTDQAGGGAEAGPTPAAKVTSDAEIAERAARLRQDPPRSLSAREQQLRAGAGLTTERLCVSELDAETVDLVDEDGRVALAVLVDGAGSQIVLLDPRTCSAIRTISPER